MLPILRAWHSKNDPSTKKSSFHKCTYEMNVEIINFFHIFNIQVYDYVHVYVKTMVFFLKLNYD